jgi:hypothetical protein
MRLCPGKHDMKTRLALLVAAASFLVCGCVVEHSDPGDPVHVVRTAPPPVTVEDNDRDVNIEVKTPPIEIKPDPPTRSTTGF